MKITRKGSGTQKNTANLRGNSEYPLTMSMGRRCSDNGHTTQFYQLKRKYMTIAQLHS